MNEKIEKTLMLSYFKKLACLKKHSRCQSRRDPEPHQKYQPGSEPIKNDPALQL
jgi:hypothetical protein